MAKYVRIKLGRIEQVVTEKAFGVIYGPKGWELVGDAPAPVDPAEELAEDEPEDPFILEVNKILRRPIAEILAWIDAGADEEAIKLRALAIWMRENSDTGRNRATLLEALSGRGASTPEPGEPGVSGVLPDGPDAPTDDEPE